MLPVFPRITLRVALIAMFIHQGEPKVSSKLIDYIDRVCSNENAQNAQNFNRTEGYRRHRGYFWGQLINLQTGFFFKISSMLRQFDSCRLHQS